MGILCHQISNGSSTHRSPPPLSDAKKSFDLWRSRTTPPCRLRKEWAWALAVKPDAQRISGNAPVAHLLVAALVGGGLFSLYFCASTIARSRAEAVSNWTRSILSLALRILFGPPKRCARFIVVIGLFPCRLDPDPANDTHRSGPSRGARATGAPAPS